eukprot:gene11957-11750_t
MIEASLGLKYDQRHGKAYYLSQLTQADVERVKQAESEQSLLVLLDKWLARMPFVNNSEYWGDHAGSFWSRYRDAYVNSLSEAEMQNLKIFDAIFTSNDQYPGDRSFSLPYELLSTLLEVDEQLSMWRHRHIHMVQRTIGKRVGTGGSTGAEYLRGAADSHYVFKELAELTSFLLPRNMLPELPASL